MAAIHDVNSHASIGDFYAKCHKLGMTHAYAVTEDCPEFSVFSVGVTLYDRYSHVTVLVSCDTSAQESTCYYHEMIDGYKVTVNVITGAMKARHAALDATLVAKLSDRKA
jgi:hypothetical protein